MIIKKFLDNIEINTYTIILIFIAFLAGLFKEIIVISALLIIHEFGHFVAIYAYKWNINRIVIYPFGGITILEEKIDKPLIEEFIITIMGPIFQEILYIIIVILYKYNYINTYIFSLFNEYNLSILIFNLLPIIPLDGSKLFNVILNKFLNFRLSYNINIVISLIFLVLFFIIFRNDSSYYIIIFYLIGQLIYYIKNRYLIFNKFILEKKLRKSEYIKYKKVKSIKNMHRNKRNLINDNGTYITEYRYTNKK